VNEQPGLTVMDDDAGGLAFVDVGEGAADAGAAAAVGGFGSERANLADVGQRRRRALLRLRCVLLWPLCVLLRLRRLLCPHGGRPAPDATLQQAHRSQNRRSQRTHLLNPVKIRASGIIAGRRLGRSAAQ
jgi:hypothetical protein